MASGSINKDSQIIEIDDDVIDLDETDKTPEEVVYEWDATIRKKLSQFAVADNENILGDLMKEYWQSLHDISRSYEDNETLKNKVFCHISFLHSYFVELQCCTADNYLMIMEDILTLYCNLAVDVIRPLKKKDFSEHKYKKRIVSVSKKLIYVLSVYLLERHDHILHVLIKMNTNKISDASSEVLKILYRHFLTKVPAFDLCDESFCRSYIVFQRWKEIRNIADWEGMDKWMYKMFKRTPESIKESETLRRILMPSSSSTVDIVLSLFRSHHAISSAYFQHLAAKRNIDIDDLDFNIDLGEDEPTLPVNSDNDEELNFLKAYCEVERNMSNSSHMISSDMPEIDIFRKCKEELDEDDDVQFVDITMPPVLDLVSNEEIENRVNHETNNLHAEMDRIPLPSALLLSNSTIDKNPDVEDLNGITRIRVETPTALPETSSSYDSSEIQMMVPPVSPEISMKDTMTSLTVAPEINEPRTASPTMLIEDDSTSLTVAPEINQLKQPSPLMSIEEDRTSLTLTPEINLLKQASPIMLIEDDRTSLTIAPKIPPSPIISVEDVRTSFMISPEINQPKPTSPIMSIGDVRTPLIIAPEVDQPKAATPVISFGDVRTSLQISPEINQPKPTSPIMSIGDVRAPLIIAPEVDQPKAATPVISFGDVRASLIIAPEINQPKVAFLSKDIPAASLLSQEKTGKGKSDTSVKKQSVEMKSIEVQADEIKYLYNDYGITTPPFEVQGDEVNTRSVEPQVFTNTGQNGKKNIPFVEKEKRGVGTQTVEVQVDTLISQKLCPYNDYGLTPPNDPHLEDHTVRLQEPLYTDLSHKGSMSNRKVETFSDPKVSTYIKEIPPVDVAQDENEEETENDTEGEPMPYLQEIAGTDSGAIEPEIEDQLLDTSDASNHDVYDDTHETDVDSYPETEYSTLENNEQEVSTSIEVAPPKTSDEFRRSDQIDTGQRAIENSAPNIAPVTAESELRETYNGNTVLKPLTSSNRTNGQAKDSASTKVMYTSSQKFCPTLDDFTRFETVIHNQRNRAKENHDLDDILSGPVSKALPVTPTTVFPSQEKAEIVGKDANSKNVPTPNSNSRSNSPNESPAYEGIDDFKHYYSKSVNGRVPASRDVKVPSSILKKGNKPRKKNARITFHASTFETRKKEEQKQIQIEQKKKLFQARKEQKRLEKQQKIKEDKQLNMEVGVLLERLSFIEEKLKYAKCFVKYDKSNKLLSAKDERRSIPDRELTWRVSTVNHKPGNITITIKKRDKNASCCNHLSEQFNKLNVNASDDGALNLTIPEDPTHAIPITEDPSDAIPIPEDLSHAIPDFEFSNSPIFQFSLPNTDKILQGFEETCAATPDLIPRNSSLLCDNSNFYKSHTITSNDHLSQNLNAVGHLSQNLNTVDHLSQNLNTEDHLSQNLNTEDHLSQNLNTVDHFSPNVNTEDHFSPNLNTEDHLSPNLNTEDHLSQNLNTEDHLNQNLNTEDPVSQNLNTEDHLSQNLSTEDHLSQNLNTADRLSQNLNTVDHFSQNLNTVDHLSQNLNTVDSVKSDLVQFSCTNQGNDYVLNLTDADVALLQLPTAVPDSYDFEAIKKNEVFSKIDWQSYEDSDGETRLPLKKRKLSVASCENLVEEVKKEEISYPATPMISIAEVEALNLRELLPNHSRPFKTPAERKEMPPLPVFYSDPSPVITDQFNVNNHTYNNPTINYHMSNVPVPFINLPCSYYSLPPIIVPFNNVSTFDQSKLDQQQQQQQQQLCINQEKRRPGRRKRQ